RSASSSVAVDKFRHVKNYFKDARFWSNLEQVVGFLDS
ncbi:hypothetical protein F442_03708, partial [Phytophthora nicotianae P10297]